MKVTRELLIMTPPLNGVTLLSPEIELSEIWGDIIGVVQIDFSPKSTDFERFQRVVRRLFYVGKTSKYAN